MRSALATAGWLVSGALLGGLALNGPLSWQAGTAVIELMHPLAVLLGCAIPLWIARSSADVVGTCVLFGAALGLPQAVVLGAQRSTGQPAGLQTITIVVISCAVVAVAVGSPGASRLNHQAAATPIRRAPVLVYAWAVGLSVLGYRISQVVLRELGTPNEERSLMLGDAEIHHLLTGWLLLILGVSAFRRLRGSRLDWVAAAIMGCAVGSILDEVIFLARLPVTDASYFHPASIIGAIGLSGSAVATSIFAERRWR